MNARDGIGRMPLHWAAQFSANAGVVEMPLAAGADLGARDEFDGYTPLHRAARYNANPAVLEVLIAAGAYLGARDDDGSTPRHNAASSNTNPAVIEFLLDAGANLEMQNANGDTPLHAAVVNNANLAVIEALLAGGANVDARNTRYETPLLARVFDLRSWFNLRSVRLRADAADAADMDVGLPRPRGASRSWLEPGLTCRPRRLMARRPCIGQRTSAIQPLSRSCSPTGPT